MQQMRINQKAFMRLSLLLLPAVFILSCTNTEIGSSKDVAPDSIFFDYNISGTEADSAITCMLRYRFGGRNGTTLVLENPSTVEIDGATPTLDSTKYAGAYYELAKPLDSFRGHHTIVFTDINKKQYKEEFDFTPFTLQTELPEKIKRESFTVKLKNFPSVATPVRLVITDTAFSTHDVNEIMSIVNGKIPIDERLLSSLKAGPINLEIYLEDEWHVKHGTKQGGKVSVSYGLKRELELTDK